MGEAGNLIYTVGDLPGVRSVTVSHHLDQFEAGLGSGWIVFYTVHWCPMKGKAPRPLSARCLNLVGWTMGLEPTTTGITILDSTN